MGGDGHLVGDEDSNDGTDYDDDGWVADGGGNKNGDKLSLITMIMLVAMIMVLAMIMLVAIIIVVAMMPLATWWPPSLSLHGCSP